MDVGTFCDHRLMNTAILKLREQYRLVYLTDKSHKLPEEITRITYTFPTSVLDNAGEMTTAFTSGWYHALMYLMVHPSITRESVVSLVDVSRLLVRTIRVHKPARILAHCGNLQHIVASRCYRTIPTSILYFAPGMLPNTSVPFVFHDALTARDLRVHGGASNSSEAERTGFAYQDQIQNSASLVERFVFQTEKERLRNEITEELVQQLVDGHKRLATATYPHLSLMTHILCFGAPLVPDLRYSIKPLHTQTVGLLPAQLSNAPIRTDLLQWIRRVKQHPRRAAGSSGGRGGDGRRYPVPVMFVSFGSFGKLLMEAMPGFVEELHRVCECLDMYAIFHDDVTKCKTVRDMATTRIRFETSFVPYPAMVRHCDLVCFTGSVCLQNVCWAQARRMLFVPYLPEQYYWAKLYQHHTNVGYVDYKQHQEALRTLGDRVSHALRADVRFHKRVQAKVSEEAASSAILQAVEGSGAVLGER